MEILLIVFIALFWTSSALQCWTYNAVEIKGILDREEHDYGLLTCQSENDVCLTKRTIIQQYAGVDNIKLFETGCGSSNSCQKGSCCRTDGCNKRLYTLMRGFNSKKKLPQELAK